jgi:hypothetical protein
MDTFVPKLTDGQIFQALISTKPKNVETKLAKENEEDILVT